MWEAPSTWRARMWPIEARFFSAEYNGLIAAPGTPKAMVTPSFSRIRTAASIARIFAMSRLAQLCWLWQRSSGWRGAISMRAILFPTEWERVTKDTINQMVDVITRWKGRALVISRQRQANGLLAKNTC